MGRWKWIDPVRRGCSLELGAIRVDCDHFDSGRRNVRAAAKPVPQSRKNSNADSADSDVKRWSCGIDGRDHGGYGDIDNLFFGPGLDRRQLDLRVDHPL